MTHNINGDEKVVTMRNNNGKRTTETVHNGKIIHTDRNGLADPFGSRNGRGGLSRNNERKVRSKNGRSAI